MIPDYQKSYWKAVELQEKVETGERRIPYARSETINAIIKLLREIQEAAYLGKS